jgi:formylglycine-generating enzyme
MGRLRVGLLALLATAGVAHAEPFQDCADCPVMVPIPPGSFVMGAVPGEEEREGVAQHIRGRSVPQHRVTIARPFALAKFAVTRGQFAAFAAATHLSPAAAATCLVFGPVAGKTQWEWQDRPGATWRDPGFPQTDRDPVVCVSWAEAGAYIAWLSGKAGKQYRLPTEAEWEYAARAGTATVRFWGDGRDGACAYANVADETLVAKTKAASDPAKNFLCSDGFPFTAPVGSLKPNPFGVNDMHGNVWQFVEDCWNPTYQGKPPTDGSAWLTGECVRRVARGGSWDNYPWDIRAAGRHSFETGFHAGDIGFRVARSM